MSNSPVQVYMSYDPSGSSVSGYMIFSNWSKYEIGSFPTPEMREKIADNWISQAEFLQNKLKNERVQALACESGKLWNASAGNHNMDKLIKLVGYSEGVCYENNIAYEQISNQSRNRFERLFLDKKITINGLTYEKIKRMGTEGGRESTRKVGVFKEQVLNEHEKDAVFLMGIYITKRLKQEGPFAN